MCQDAGVLWSDAVDATEVGYVLKKLTVPGGSDLSAILVSLNRLASRLQEFVLLFHYIYLILLVIRFL